MALRYEGSTINTQLLTLSMSFVATDIDSAQGVVTDMANLLEIVPPESYLKKDGALIYDAHLGAQNIRALL